jgi:hypothetical protein
MDLPWVIHASAQDVVHGTQTGTWSSQVAICVCLEHPSTGGMRSKSPYGVAQKDSAEHHLLVLVAGPVVSGPKVSGLSVHTAKRLKAPHCLLWTLKKAAQKVQQTSEEEEERQLSCVWAMVALPNDTLSPLLLSWCSHTFGTEWNSSGPEWQNVSPWLMMSSPSSAPSSTAHPLGQNCGSHQVTVGLQL